MIKKLFGGKTAGAPGHTSEHAETQGIILQPDKADTAAETVAETVNKKEKRNKKKAQKRTLGVKKGLTPLQKGIIIAASILCLFAIAGVVMYFSSGAANKVYVVNVGSITQYNGYMSDSGSSYGMVKAENIQAQYVSEYQHVNHIFVEEGDHVEVGDLVMTYDTTLDSLEVDKKALKASELELELVNLKKQLSIINSMKPSSPSSQPAITEEPTENPTGEIVLTYKKLEGSGTQEDPCIYVIAGTDIPCDDAFLSNEIFTVSNTVYVVFENRTSNRVDGHVRQAWGVCFSRTPENTTSFNFFDASEYIYTYSPGEIVEDMGSGYTAAEIASMRRETQDQIEEKELEVKMANIEVAQMRLELSGGEVYSSVSGVVKSVLTEEEARNNDMPVLLISGGGGFTVEGTISELMLDSISVGAEATVMSYENGMTYDGIITSIIDLPTEDEYYRESAAASYYPVTVFVEEEANLREYEFVSINFDTKVKNAKYLESMFVLNENGNSYVYVAGSDGLLEKRRISTGGTMYGYLTQVIGGITDEDYIAFPYGNNIRDGAKVRQCTIDEFYSHMYGY